MLLNIRIENVLMIGLLVAIVIPSNIAAYFPDFTIQLLERLRLYKKDSLSYKVENYVNTSGYHRRKVNYRYKNRKHYVRKETFRVTLWLILFSLPFTVGIALGAFFMFAK